MSEKFYIDRDDNNKIIHCYFCEQYAGQELIDTNSSDWQNYLLEQAKYNKIVEVNNYYNNQQNWLMTIYDNVNHAGITETLSWFKLNLNCCIGGIILHDNNNNPINYEFTREQIDNILNKCGFEFGYKQMKFTKDRLLVLINSQETIDNINQINIEKEFENINRIVNL